MARWYVSSVANAAVAQWAALTAYTLGQYVRQLAAPALNAERVWKCTTAGTSGAAEPGWNLNAGTNTTSGTAVFKEVTGLEAEQAAGNWQAAAARLGCITTRGTAGSGAGTFFTAGDDIYMSSDHAETQAQAWAPWNTSASFNGTRFISASRAGGSSMPPVSADLTPGASISTTGAFNIQICHQNNNSFLSVHWKGVTFSAGSAANLANVLIQVGSVFFPSWSLLFEDCTFILNNTNAGSLMYVGGTNQDSTTRTVKWKNCTVQFNATGQTISVGTVFEWISTVAAIGGASVPTVLFTPVTGSIYKGANIDAHGVDLSAVNTALFANSTLWDMSPIQLINCRLNSGVAIISGSPITPFQSGMGGKIALVNCDDSTSASNYRFAWYVSAGNILSDTVVIRDGGASDGVTPISWKATTNTGTAILGPTLLFPLNLPTIRRRFNTTGSAVTLTICGISNTASLLTDAQAWVEAEILATSGYPLSTFYSGRVADILAAAANVATDTSDWSTAAPARQNSHAYSLGDPISVASAAAGTVWFCTTAGTSSGSEPGGYSAATDGASVTDGSAVFRAGRRFKLTVGFTPQMEGVIRAGVKLAVASSTVYIDPKLDIA